MDDMDKELRMMFYERDTTLMTISPRENTDGIINEISVRELLHDKDTQKDINQYPILKLVNSTNKKPLVKIWREPRENYHGE